MILYFRLLLALFFGLFRPRHTLTEVFECSFTVMPWDSEFTVMNSARYFSFAEVAQWTHNLCVGALKAAVTNKWWVVVRSQYLAYAKGIRVFQKFIVKVRVIGWDEKYFYWESSFYNTQGKRLALGWSKVQARNRAGFVAPMDVLSQFGVKTQSPPLPEAVLNRLNPPDQLYS